MRPATISHSWVGPLTAGCDAAALIGLGAVSGRLYGLIAGGQHDDRHGYVVLGFIVAVLTVSLFKSRGLYDRSFVAGEHVVTPVLRTWLAVFSLLAIAAFLLGIGNDFSRGALVVYFATGGVALVGIRRSARGLLRRAIDAGSFKARRVILIGDSAEVSLREFRHVLRCHGYALTRAFLFDADETLEAIDSRLSLREIAAAVKSGDVDEILLAFRWTEAERIDDIVSRLRILPVPVRLLPDRAAARYIAQPMTDIGLARSIDLQRSPIRVWQRVVKSVFDFVAAAAALLLLSPLMVTVAVLIKLDSPGPIFFRQTRIGFNGKRFRIFKFRTMRTLDDGGVIRQATRDDERVTRVGRWLRSTSVDELPQLFNVLLGEMSVVGPRPHAEAHDSQFDRTIANYALRHHVRPGITGWAQVCGFRGETPTMDLVLKRVEHDLWYINNWSFWLDTIIVARTAVALMNPKDVY